MVDVRVAESHHVRDAEIRKDPAAYDLGSDEETIGDYAGAVA
jgi:hypothetical protein